LERERGPMRFIPYLSQETIPLLQKVYQQSKYHRVRQRAQCILLSYQGYTIKELSHIFKVDRVTIYNWFNNWESRHFAGLYDRNGKGRPQTFNQEQKEQIRQWTKLYPKNLNKVIALIEKEFGISTSKSTIKRILKSFQMTWRRIRKKVKKHPDPEVYQERKEALEILIEEDKQGIIDLRYYDESGMCLIPYIPYAWQEAEETIAIASGHSKRINVLGFMNKRNDLDAYTIEGPVDSAVAIHFFNEFSNTIQGPTVVVVDNASMHTSEAFQEEIPKWEKKGLSIFYLPEYSPELNLIEIFWRFMKYEWIEFWAYTDFASLIQYVEGVIKGFGDKYKINFG
jgi:transposase